IRISKGVVHRWYHVRRTTRHALCPTDDLLECAHRRCRSEYAQRPLQSSFAAAAHSPAFLGDWAASNRRGASAIVYSLYTEWFTLPRKRLHHPTPWRCEPLPLLRFRVAISRRFAAM